VNFSSLDVHLHTEALLNSMNFLNSLLPPSSPKEEGGAEELPTIPEEEEEEGESEEGKKEESVVAKIKCNLCFHPFPFVFGIMFFFLLYV
jgi:vacuolar protein sorting-associated protein 13A/C